MLLLFVKESAVVMARTRYFRGNVVSCGAFPATERCGLVAHRSTSVEEIIRQTNSHTTRSLGLPLRVAARYTPAPYQLTSFSQPLSP